jgi:hypothetical protein
MKNLLIIVFCKIDNKKIEEKRNVQKTLTVALFNFVTFRHHVSLFAFATFRHFSCERLCSEFSKLEERKI